MPRRTISRDLSNIARAAFPGWMLYARTLLACEYDLVDIVQRDSLVDYSRDRALYKSPSLCLNCA